MAVRYSSHPVPERGKVGGVCPLRSCMRLWAQKFRIKVHTALQCNTLLVCDVDSTIDCRDICKLNTVCFCMEETVCFCTVEMSWAL